MSASTSSAAPADPQASSFLPSSDRIATNIQQQQDSTAAPAEQTTQTWKLRLPTIDCWNIFLATAAVLLTIIFGLPAWLSLYPRSDAAEILPIPQSGPDPVTAMICIQFYDHPLVQQSGQCAGVSLAQLEVLSMGLHTKAQVDTRQFEDFLVIREIERNTQTREERREWPPHVFSPGLVYPELLMAAAHPGKDWLKSDDKHYFKEWATIIWDQYIPITRYVLIVSEPGETQYTATWHFVRAVEFFSPKSIFDIWDQYFFTIATLSTTSDCFGCIDAEIPLIHLRHPFNFTLQDKADRNPLLHMDEMDCDMLKRWSTNKQWRHECAWPEVYQNYARLQQEGYLERDPPLKMDELSEIVKNKGGRGGRDRIIGSFEYMVQDTTQYYQSQSASPRRLHCSPPGHS